MKRRLSFLRVAFALMVALPACSPSIQTAQTPGSALVRIECYNASVEQIMGLLRSERGKDISVSADRSYVTAAFSPADTSPEKLAQIIYDLSILPGVLHVETMENPRPIRQNF